MIRNRTYTERHFDRVISLFLCTYVSYYLASFKKILLVGCNNCNNYAHVPKSSILLLRYVLPS